MPPKRKQNAEKGEEPSLAKGETLASACELGVEKLLKKSNKHRRITQQSSLPPELIGILPALKSNTSRALTCGAPQANVETNNKSQGKDDAEEQEQTQQLQKANVGGGVDWEDLDCFDDGDNIDNTNSGLSPSTAGNLSTEDLSLTIDLPAETGDGPSTSKGPQARRTTYTKRDREIAKLVHRSHLLCLLGRGLLYDAAAEDPTLQALVLSIIPFEITQELKPGCSQEAIGRAVEWFHSSFTLTPGIGRPAPLEGEDEIEAALKAAKGIDGIATQLFSVLESLKGSAEELATLFAALLRGQGVAARTVRRLEPSPLKPADVARQLENTMKGFAKSSQPPAKKSKAAPVDTAEAAETIGKKAKKSSGTLRKKLQASSEIAAGGSERATSAGAAHRRKCDEEFEQQIAIAMAATAFDHNKPDNKPINDASNVIVPGSRPNSLPQKAAELALLQKKASKGAAALGSAQGSVFGNVLGASGGGRFWVEAYCGTLEDGKWLHADPVLGWVNRPDDVEALAPKGQPLLYAVAHAGGGAKDVTRRYTKSMVAAEKLRDGEWWEVTLRPLRSAEAAAHAGGFISSQPTGPSSSRNNNNASTSRDHSQHKFGGIGRHLPSASIVCAREDRELEVAAAKERKDLPTTIDGFRSHPLYVLQRHIGRHQALKPDCKPIGLHRGEAYYDRKDLGEIHTAERWRRMGREVLSEELSQPVKQLKKRVINTNNSAQKYARSATIDALDDNGDDETYDGEVPNDATNTSNEAMSSFYGEWQTREWIPPSAENGKVPKNDRGNVEVPPFAACLPRGTAHINMQGVAAVCKRLGIDFAPALAGFDIRGGRSVPRIEGAVVCLEHEDIVREAVEQDIRHREQLAQEQREAAAEANWYQLLRAVVTRVRLQKNGSGCGDGGAQAEAAAALLHDTIGSGQGNNVDNHNVSRSAAAAAAAAVAVDDDEIVDLTGDDIATAARNGQEEQRTGGETQGAGMAGVDIEEI